MSDTLDLKELKKQLGSSRKNGYGRVDAATLEEMERYCADYLRFLDASKTERLCAAECVKLADAAGYEPFQPGMAVTPATIRVS